MTMIAYRDGVLAADTLAVVGERRGGTCLKIKRLEDGTLYGASGSVGECQDFLNWLPARSGQCPIGDNSTAIIIHPGGAVEMIEAEGNNPRSFFIDAPFYARGSGAHLAIGAMAAGATAEEAVRIAVTYDVCSGGDVTVLRR